MGRRVPPRLGTRRNYYLHEGVNMCAVVVDQTMISITIASSDPTECVFSTSGIHSI